MKLKSEILGYSLISIVEEMGISLRKSSYSHNIKERADHSCIVANNEGKILAQAEHLPVHLGSFYVGFKNFLKYIEENDIKIEEGDMFIVNDPYIIGTHLNDITIIRPVFYSGKLAFFVANKAHHIDVGGIYAGSINWECKNLYEEGIVIQPVKIMRKNRLCKEILKIIKFKIATFEIFLGDLFAQISSNILGERRLVELVHNYGLEVFNNEISNFLENTKIKVLKSLSKFKEGKYYAEDYLEYDTSLIKICCNLEFKKNGIKINFNGTSKQLDKPLNAVFGVTFASSSFAIRCLIEDPELPINDGFYSILEVEAERGSLLNPVKPAPVSAGNTETSQRIVDVIFKALSHAYSELIPAASQGTMNNLILSGKYENGEKWIYYETIGGGFGARFNKDGVNAVQVNMTNTMNTPVEEIERNYPLMVFKYEIRQDSCGSGKWRGGCGIERGFLALDEINVSIIAERNIIKPYGLAGGFEGENGEILLLKGNETKKLPSKFSFKLNKGGILIIKTPGGGGYGKPHERDLKLIISDLLNEYISIEKAVKDYNLDYQNIKSIIDKLKI
jgi:N-methylhydantoinase B/acetone carboxylase, alpha subunit